MLRHAASCFSIARVPRRLTMDLAMNITMNIITSSTAIRPVPEER